MLLWQLDLVGGVFLAGSRECKILTGIDVSLPAYRGGRCARGALRGGRRCVPRGDAGLRVPSEVLTDNHSRPEAVGFDVGAGQSLVVTRS